MAYNAQITKDGLSGEIVPIKGKDFREAGRFEAGAHPIFLD